MAGCELCKLSLNKNEGYIVNTSQLVSVPSFWEGRFTEALLGLKRKFRDDIPQMEADKKFKYFILKECHVETGRLVCSGCMSQFSMADRDKASQYALEYWKTEDKGNYRNKETGSASVEEAVKIAGPIWKRMSGKAPPEVKDNREPVKSQKKGCFIATSCYGDYNCREVMILRNFRDGHLEKNFFGSLIVKIYYLFSPVIADFLENKPGLKIIIRRTFLHLLVLLISGLFRQDSPNR